jgi:hypothetical protein
LMTQKFQKVCKRMLLHFQNKNYNTHRKPTERK